VGNLLLTLFIVLFTWFMDDLEKNPKDYYCPDYCLVEHEHRELPQRMDDTEGTHPK